MMLLNPKVNHAFPQLQSLIMILYFIQDFIVLNIYSKSIGFYEVWLLVTPLS